jgi:hypothetical protein
VEEKETLGTEFRTKLCRPDTIDEDRGGPEPDAEWLASRALKDVPSVIGIFYKEATMLCHLDIQLNVRTPTIKIYLPTVERRQDDRDLTKDREWGSIKEIDGGIVVRDVDKRIRYKTVDNNVGDVKFVLQDSEYEITLAKLTALNTLELQGNMDVLVAYCVYLAQLWFQQGKKSTVSHEEQYADFKPQ